LLGTCIAWNNECSYAHLESSFTTKKTDIFLPYTRFSAAFYKSVFCMPDIMPDIPENFLHLTARTLLDLEPSIPGLHERMIVRTLRMLMENGFVEASRADAADIWTRIVEIYVELRDIISALASVGDCRSAASRLCSGISDGLKVKHPDFEHLGAAEIIALYTTETEQILFVVGLYKRICRALESLTGDAELMRQLGNNSLHAFVSLTTRAKMIIESGETYHEQLHNQREVLSG